MKQGKALAAAAVPMAFSLSSLAAAQHTYRVWIGGGRPNSSTIRDLINDTSEIFGLGYDLPMNGAYGMPSLNLDFNHNASSGNHLDTWALTYDTHFGFSKGSTGGFMPYYGYGVGVFHHDLGLTVPTGGGGGSSGGGSSGGGNIQGIGGGSTRINKSATRLGAKLILGAWISDRFYIEGNYRFSGKVGGIGTDGLTMVVGVRF